MQKSTRLTSIDALRGLVMVIMLLDHIRETFLLHLQVSDPVNALTVAPALFFTRLTSTLCAPIFVALTGLGAYLYANKHSRAETSVFLLQRGLFLILLEFTLVNTAWRAEVPPTVVYLQVIWAIGLCMVVLAALIHLPERAVLVLGVVIVCCHNLLDGVVMHPGDPLYLVWGVLHERVSTEWFGIPFKFNYPLLPWIGVICLGWSLGPWYTALESHTRRKRLLVAGLALLGAFILLRSVDAYGDIPWMVAPGDGLRTAMSFLALTKYPPSLLFLLSTLGVGLLLLLYFERRPDSQASRCLTQFGGAPMFFYLLHLWCLRLLYLFAIAAWGPNQGVYYGFPSVGVAWLMFVVLAALLYFPTAWFARFKQKRKDIAWLKFL